MTSRPLSGAAEPPPVVVAGHICLDLIPRLPAGGRSRTPRAGALDPLGPMALSVGGCVGNTGIALHRLGLRATLVARVGDDRLGGMLSELVREAVPASAARLIVAAGEPTSYSLISNLPGQDRAIRHFTGVNDTFTADDVPDELLDGASLLHVGYPPLMAAMVASDGRELRRLLERARGRGLTTSLDMANANLDPGESRVRWLALLERVLPEVDVFLPSLAEASHLLRRRVHRDAHGAPALASVARLGDEMIGLGVAIAGVKLGEHGLYVRTASAARLSTVRVVAARRSAGPGRMAASAGPGRIPPGWADRELYSSVFLTDVVGTTGAGDATIAGFLFGLLMGLSPAETVTVACAVGGSSTEAVDGTSSVPSWPEIERRLERGWRRKAATPGPVWTASGEAGLWYGSRDATGAAPEMGLG